MSHATRLGLCSHSRRTPWPCPAAIDEGDTHLPLKEKSMFLVQPRPLVDAPTSASQGPGACCAPDFEYERGQRIRVWDPPALFSCCGFCLCSDPGAKKMLHCLRDLNVMAQPVPEQALSKLSSNLSRLNQEAKIAGTSKKTSQMKEELCIDQFEREKNGKAGGQQHSGMLYIRKTLKISDLLGLYLRSIYFHRPTCPFWRPLIPSLQRPVAKRDTERSEGGGEH